MTKKIFHTKVLWLGMNDNYDNLSFLQKYAPKFYSKVDFEISNLQNHQILSKTRFIKIIRSAKIQDYTSYKKGLVMRALRNKSKTLQRLKGSDLDLHKNFQNLQQFRLLTGSLSSWRALLSLQHLTSLTIESSSLEIETAGNSKAFERFKWRFWAHIPEMRNLKRLSCNFYGIITTSNYHFLQKLGTFPRFLSSLNTLTLDLNLLEDHTFEIFNLDRLSQQVNILRAKELSSSVFTRFLGNFQTYKNLHELSILQVMILEESKNPLPALVCLKNFHTLNELQSLELSFDFSDEKGFGIFLENFSLPPSIKNIRLSFQELTLDEFQATSSSDLYFQFCQKWKNLPHLNSLSFTFLESSNIGPFAELNLILPILKIISRLTSLYFSSFNELGVETTPNIINFQHLWDEIQHLRPTLETLYIESALVSIENTQIEAPLGAIKTLSICGKIIGEDQMLNLFKLFSNDPSCKSRLFLGSLSPTSKEDLIHLLKDFRYFPSHIGTCININLASLEAKDLISALCSGDQSLRIRHKENLRLSLSSIPNLKQSKLDKIVDAFEKTGISCCLQISDRGGNILFSGDNWDEIS
jgi:hypothetical protein